MDKADPQKKARSRLLQRQLNECRERIRILLEGKVRRWLIGGPGFGSDTQD